MEAPKQATWTVRKIFNMRKHWQKLEVQPKVIGEGRFQISIAYKQLRGMLTNISWIGEDILQQWGMNIAATCALCDECLEILQHILFECAYSHGTWTTILSLMKWQRSILSWDLERSWVLKGTK